LRFLRRPLQMLGEWHGRYGDAFTVKLSGFGTGIYVVDPEAIRELFTGDQSDLRAGEANSFMEPVLGPHSVLVLDGPSTCASESCCYRRFRARGSPLSATSFAKSPSARSRAGAPAPSWCCASGCARSPSR
jgi:cytochrome P450